MGAVREQEQVLVELSLWLARILQYSASHPACAELGAKVHRTLSRALQASSPISYGVLADDVVFDDTPTRHPAIRGRLAPHLHERGVLLLRFSHGVTLDELTTFVELLTLPTQTIYDRGGMLRLVLERGLVRVQVEEIAHEVTDDERNAQRTRRRLRDFFRDMLRNLIASRSVDVALRERLAELLAHPDIACSILQEDPVGIAEAVAGFSLMVRQEEQRRGLRLAPRLREVLLALSPQSKARLLVGLPSLVGEFRAALVWAFEAFSEDELARMAFPAVRAHAADLDAVLYALSVAVPGDGRRIASLRWLALALYDLPLDDATALEALGQIARPVAMYESYRDERECLQVHAARAVASAAFRAPPAPFDMSLALASPGVPALTIPPVRPLSMPPVSIAPGAYTSSMPPPFSMPPPGAPEGSTRPPPLVNGRFTVAEVIRIAARTGALGRLCRALPSVAEALVEEGASDAVVGVVRGLSDVAPHDTSGLASVALHAVGSSPAAAKILDEIDTASAATEGDDLADMVATVNLVVMLAPEAAVERLETTQNRKMRRVLLDALPHAGASLLPLVRSRLMSSQWYVVRNAVLLIGRCGGTTRDLASVARHPNEKVRLEVARALRAVPQDEASMEIVAGYLADPSHEVSQIARILLRGELLGVGSIATVEAFAADESQPEDIRLRCVTALGRSAHDAAAEALFKLIHPRGLLDTSAGVRDAAAVALRASHAPGAAALFEEGLRSSTRRVRKSCERAAGSGG